MRVRNLPSLPDQPFLSPPILSLLPSLLTFVFQVIGIALAFGGVVLGFFEGLFIGQLSYFFGDAMVLFSSFLLGSRQVYVKRLTQQMHPVRLLLWQGILSVPVFLFLCLLFERGTSIQLNPEIISAILYQGLVVAGFCFIMLTTLLRRYMASKLGVFAFANPLLGVVLSNLLLGEHISLLIILSVLLVGIGITIVNSRE